MVLSITQDNILMYVLGKKKNKMYQKSHTFFCFINYLTVFQFILLQKEVDRFIEYLTFSNY